MQHDQTQDLTPLMSESPQRVPPTTFNFDDLVVNRAFAAQQMKSVSEVIEDTADYQMVRTGDGFHGWIFLYNIQDQTADYVIQYKVRRWNWLPATVTQCILWHDPKSSYIRNATVRMFFGYLLRHYDAIMSDALQTDDGNRFWMRRMTDAINKG